MAGFNQLEPLWKLYLPLVGWVGLGLSLGYRLPPLVPLLLGKFLFWVGVPLSIMAFLRQADLSASVWIAPAAAWIAIGFGFGLGWGWIQIQIYLNQSFPPHSLAWLHWISSDRLQSSASQGSFLLSSMVGNTGYLGYPISLALVGTQLFGWAVFYDTLGSALGSYGLGVILAAHFGNAGTQTQWWSILTRNPALWSFGLGLGLRTVPLPEPAEQGIQTVAWMIVALSLLLLGMRLSQLNSWQNLQLAAISLSIKMVIVPLIIGVGLSQIGITGLPRLAIVLQAAMPPAFATLILTEAYDLDRDFAVTALALGSILLLLLLPLWLTVFAPA